jgi:hypothetical protein
VFQIGQPYLVGERSASLATGLSHGWGLRQVHGDCLGTHQACTKNGQQSITLANSNGSPVARLRGRVRNMRWNSPPARRHLFSAWLLHTGTPARLVAWKSPPTLVVGYRGKVASQACAIRRSEEHCQRSCRAELTAMWQGRQMRKAFEASVVPSRDAAVLMSHVRKVVQPEKANPF